MIGIAIALVLIPIFIYLISNLISSYKNLKLKGKIILLTNELEKMTPDEFKIYKKNIDEFSGVYIFYNKNKNMYYVGQAKEVLHRVSRHLRGRGNGDVYADYKYGDSFTIQLIDLKSSGFKSLNLLEKSAIMTFNSYDNGYNKTRGNEDGGSSNPFYSNDIYRSKYNKKEILKLLDKCAKGQLEAPFETYMEIRRGLFGYDMKYPGIFIIYNKTKNLYYIAKSNDIFNAINKHFSGHGNNDIYADYKYGDDIVIKTLSEGYNKYKSLDELITEYKKEYNEIADYYSKTEGINKGNYNS